jgi:hypothetical protein
MPQSRLTSFAEALVIVAVGYSVAVATQLVDLAQVLQRGSTPQRDRVQGLDFAHRPRRRIRPAAVKGARQFWPRVAQGSGTEQPAEVIQHDSALNEGKCQAWHV